MRTKRSTHRLEIAAETNANAAFDIEPLPASMETTGPKLVYLYLQVVEETTIEELAETLGMKLLTLYPMLNTLESDGLVVRNGETYATENTHVSELVTDGGTTVPNESESAVAK